MQGCSAQDIESHLVSADGPQTNATQPDYVKFHDDKVRYLMSDQSTCKQPMVTHCACSVPNGVAHYTLQGADIPNITSYRPTHRLVLITVIHIPMNC